MMIIKINSVPVIATTVQETPTDFYTSLANIGDFFVATKDFFIGIGHFFSNVGGVISNIKEVGLIKWIVLGLADISDVAIIIALVSLILMMFGWNKGKTVTYWSIIGYILLKVAGLVASSL